MSFRGTREVLEELREDGVGWVEQAKCGNLGNLLISVTTHIQLKHDATGPGRLKAVSGSETVVFC